MTHATIPNATRQPFQFATVSYLIPDVRENILATGNIRRYLTLWLHADQ